MKQHVKNYFEAFGYDKSDAIQCEYPTCFAAATDVHHIEPRSKFGSKMKAAQDSPDNLIALCRMHHDHAHGPNSRNMKEVFKAIVNARDYKQKLKA